MHVRHIQGKDAQSCAIFFPPLHTYLSIYVSLLKKEEKKKRKRKNEWKKKKYVKSKVSFVVYVGMYSTQ